MMITTAQQRSSSISLILLVVLAIALTGGQNGSFPTTCSAFMIRHHSSSSRSLMRTATSTISTSTSLHAKAGKSKNKKKIMKQKITNIGSGFGKTVETPPSKPKSKPPTAAAAAANVPETTTITTTPAAAVTKSTTNNPTPTKESDSGNDNNDDDYIVFPALESSVLSTLIASEDVTTVGDLTPELYDRVAQIYGFEHFNYEKTPPPPPPQSQEQPEEEDEKQQEELIGSTTAAAAAAAAAAETVKEEEKGQTGDSTPPPPPPPPPTTQQKQRQQQSSSLYQPSNDFASLLFAQPPQPPPSRPPSSAPPKELGEFGDVADWMASATGSPSTTAMSTGTPITYPTKAQATAQAQAQAQGGGQTDQSMMTPTSTTTPNDFFSTKIIKDTTNDIDLDNNTDLSNILSQLPPFTKFRILHVDPMVLAIDDFFTNEECDRYRSLCEPQSQTTTTSSSANRPLEIKSKTVGKDENAKAQRTSTTWFHHYHTVPELMAKASRLLGLNTIDQWEEPQTVRYQPSEKFTWHLDALAPSDTLEESGGQRIATLLVYLADVDETNGGATVFRDLGGNDDDGIHQKYLKMHPKKGSALLFFPAAGGIPNVPLDIRTLHAGEAMSTDSSVDKWIAQLWLRETSKYEPTGPPGNTHAKATSAIKEYCSSSSKQ